MMNRRRGVLVVSVAMIVASVETNLANLMFPVLREDFGLTTTALGIFTCITLLARALFGPAWGMLADRFGRKRVLASCVLAWSVCVAITGMAHNYGQFLTLYALGVIGAAAAEPISDSLLSDFFRPQQRGRAYGILRGLLSLGVGVLMPFMGWMSAHPGGWRYGYGVIGLLQLVGGLLLVFGLKEPEVGASESVRPPTRDRFSFRDVPKLLEVPSVQLLAVNYILATSIVLLAYLPTFMTEVRGYTIQSASAIYGTMHIGAVIGAMLGGVLGDWAELRSPLKGRIQLMQLYLVVFALFTIVIFQIPRMSEPIAFVVLFCFGVVFPIGFSGCVLPMLSTVILPEMRGTGFGLLACLCQGLSLTITSLTVGALATQYGLQRMLFLSITVPYALNAIIWTRFYRIYPKDVAEMQRRLDARAAELRSREVPEAR